MVGNRRVALFSRSQVTALRVGGFPALSAHSGALGVTVELDSFNGLYTHTPGDDTPDGFPIWRTGAAGDQQRFLYFNTTRYDWVFNSALSPESDVHWAKAKESPAIEDSGPVGIGGDMPWEVFNGAGMQDMALSVSCVYGTDDP